LPDEEASPGAYIVAARFTKSIWGVYSYILCHSSVYWIINRVHVASKFVSDDNLFESYSSILISSLYHIPNILSTYSSLALMALILVYYDGTTVLRYHGITVMWCYDTMAMVSYLTSIQMSKRAQSMVVMNLSVEQAVETRDSLAKALYSALFDWVT